MTYARVAAVLTWAYTAGFGITAIWVAFYLRRRGELPTFFDMFPMYGGPWFSRFSQGTFVALLATFASLTLVTSWAAWLVWNGSRTGAIIGFAFAADRCGLLAGLRPSDTVATRPRQGRAVGPGLEIPRLTFERPSVTCLFTPG
jgi:hypothetical protein